MNKYSYSKITLYGQCPRRYKFRYIDKIKKDEDNPIFEKGHYIHYLLEFYPNTPPKPFEFKFHSPAAVEQLNKIVFDQLKNDPTLKTMLRNHRIRAEQVFNLDSDMQPTTDKDKSIFTGIIDYIGRDDEYLTFIDWKSGKTKKATMDQIEYYALWGFKTFTNFNQIKIILWFIEIGEKFEVILNREDMDAIQEKLINKLNEIENDDTFKQNKGKACDWCPYFDECIKKDLKTWQSI